MCLQWPQPKVTAQKTGVESKCGPESVESWWKIQIDSKYNLSMKMAQCLLSQWFLMKTLTLLFRDATIQVVFSPFNLSVSKAKKQWLESDFLTETTLSTLLLRLTISKSKWDRIKDLICPILSIVTKTSSSRKERKLLSNWQGWKRLLNQLSKKEVGWRNWLPLLRLALLLLLKLIFLDQNLRIHVTYWGAWL